jgi:hypothetical protein
MRVKETNHISMLFFSLKNPQPIESNTDPLASGRSNTPS